MTKGAGKVKTKDAVGEKPEKPEKKSAKEKKDAISKRASKKSQNFVPPSEIPRRVTKQEIVLEPEWDSDSVKAHKLFADGFNYCMVMAMEDSAELTSIGHYLYHAIKTGVRKQFIAINGEEIAAKAKQCLVALKSSGRESNDQDFWERLDIWAEAVKYSLMQMKNSVTTEINAGSARKELELTGARSKDMIQRMKVPLVMKGSDEQSDESGSGGGIMEPPPVPPSTSRTGSGNDDDPNFKKKKGILSPPSTTGSVAVKPLGSDGSNSSSNKSRSANMRKRGEIPLPSLEEINDTPQKGPQLYIVLQGFYNPKIIQELLKIGVTVDGILLLTDQEVTKRNFSVADIEDSIPGTFRPKNILPSYLKYMEQQTNLPRDDRDVVGQFWAGLAEMCNTAPPDSPLLDCALMNFKLPKNEHGLESSDARGAYASKLFDEAAQRIYEMLVMSDWFHDYTNCSTVKEIKPMEKEIDREMYEALLNQVPSECVTVPIIMECILEQVVTSVEKEKLDPESSKGQHAEGDDQAKYSEFNKFGKPDWGSSILQDGLKTLKAHSKKEEKSKELGPTFTPPLYIKNGDSASIRSCHLNETVASHIASTQVAGDFRNIQGLMWNNIPEFNRGLYIKLLANLNHFMYFLPPEALRIEDMFFVLHLLMSAGVEAQLRKETELAGAKEEQQRYAKKRFSQMVHSTTTELFSSHTGMSEEKPIEGTNLSLEHNYLALNELSGVHFILAPDSNAEISIAPIGHSKENPENDIFLPNTLVEPPPLQETLDTEVTPDKVELSAKPETTHPSKGKGKKGHADKTKAADIATKKAIETAVELVENPPVAEESLEAFEEEGAAEDEGFVESDVEGAAEEEEEGEDKEDVVEYNFGDPDLPIRSLSNKFIACEEEWFKDMKDFSVFKALLECPALLAISESGALDLSQWVETYLLSAGMSQVGGDGVLIGNLSDWNYVEELVPIQTVQLLNDAMSNYLSMQRMYCPFYDTLLFIFNNPIPQSLKSESQFYTRLKTLPGLQHFLEYTINDKDVLSWLMGIEKVKGAEVIDSLSITTLMKIVPEEQWLLVPSIKYMLYKEQTGQLSASDTKLLKAVTEKDLSDGTGDGAEDKSKSSKKISGSQEEETDDSKPPKGRRLSEIDKKKKKSSKDSDIEIKTNKLVPIPEESTPTSGELEVDVIPSFHINEAIGQRKNSKSKAKAKEISKPSASPKAKFDFYDLGKRVIVVASDTYHLFPMDGTTIQYEISTIEPEFRMMQLQISKNGHNTFFYPYYIPHDLDVSKETYVVCPYFHMLHANGTIFAFQDRRATQSAPYIKVLMRQSGTENLFSYDKVIFGKDVKDNKQENDAVNSVESQEIPTEIKRKSEIHQSPVDPSDKDPSSQGTSTSVSDKPPSPSNVDEGSSEVTTEKPDDDALDTIGDDSVDAKKQKKKGGKKEKAKEQEKPIETKVKEDKLKKKVKGDKKKNTKSETTLEFAFENVNDEEETVVDPEQSATPPPETKSPDEAMEWAYSDGELTDTEAGSQQHWRKNRPMYAPTWDNAEILLQPMVHTLKISLPSGLMLEVDDILGLPLTRGVRQAYGARGTAATRKESSRHYTMNGTAIRFMQNGTIQILTARGVTTNIREISTTAQKDEENLQEVFNSALDTKIFNGDIILPSGEFWHIVEGKKAPHDPIYVFTSGPLPNGEIFRRRQDGVVFLHRHDGTTITHYPDGTRFTTRMVIQRDLPEELEGWVVVGLKYMVEHPNYCSVIFNTLSGNSHIRLPLGDWVRVFADGSMKITTTDNYSMDVDKIRAVLSYPPCGEGDINIPNLTAVKLFHSKELFDPSQEETNDSMKTTEETELDSEPTASENNAKLSLESEGKRSLPEETMDTGSIKSIKVKPAKEIPDGKKTRGQKAKPTNNKSLRDNKKRNSKGEEIKSVTIEGLDGEAIEEESYLDEEEEEQGDEEIVDEVDINVEENDRKSQEMTKETKKFEVLDFLRFTDSTLLCKAIDSWDNRFAVDVYGETIVDRAKESAPRFSTEELINTLSKHCQLPKEFVSGILRTTSSDDLATAARRIAALIKSPTECGKVAPTKIFVVKRNLSGYEYVKEGHVEAAMNKARMVRDAMVVVDPLPRRDPRKYITIMEPVSEAETPRGMWTNSYREPTFRPTLPTNKQLQTSNREDLRWFGYVLNAANSKRPKFIPNARADFVKKRKEMKLKEKLNPTVQTNPAQELPTNSAIWGEEGDMADESEVTEQIFIQEEKPDKMRKSRDKGKLGKADKKEKADKKDKGNKKSRQDVHKASASVLHTKKDRKSAPRGDTKKNLRTPNSFNAGNRESRLNVPPENEEEESLDLEEETEEPPQVKTRLDQTEIGQYPENVKDIKGIYGEEEPPKFQPQYHADVCTERKAIVVRSFVEIPQIDEKMQRALLAASVSYGQTVEGQLNVLEGSKFQDPRTEEERKQMLEQRAGRELRFHF